MRMKGAHSSDEGLARQGSVLSDFLPRIAPETWGEAAFGACSPWTVLMIICGLDLLIFPCWFLKAWVGCTLPWRSTWQCVFAFISSFCKPKLQFVWMSAASSSWWGWAPRVLQSSVMTWSCCVPGRCFWELQLASPQAGKWAKIMAFSFTC